MLTAKRSDIHGQRIRLIRKFAEVINGVDLSPFQVGDVIRVSEGTAVMLIREGWAELLSDDQVSDSLPS